MVILGQEIGSNPRTLVLIHATRIVVVVFYPLLIMFVPKLSVDMLPNPDLFYNWQQLPFVLSYLILGWFWQLS